MEGENGQVRNCYYDAFDEIVSALDALAKTLSLDPHDDGTPIAELPVRDQNSYFESFRAMAAALGRVKKAMEERLDAVVESDPVFEKWRGESRSVAIGKNAAAKDSELPTVQLGAGSNSEGGTLQFRHWQLVGADGKIPKARLPEGISEVSFAFASPAAEDGVIRLADKSVNDVALDGGAVGFEFPAAMERARSFLLRLTMASETEWSLPADAEFESDDDLVFADVEAGSTVVFIFSETVPGKFMVSRKTSRTVTKE